MGKYMRKDKHAGEVAVVEVSTHQPSLGVRTRARTLAAAAAAAAQDSSPAYLELRSRRLEKPLSPPHASKTKATIQKNTPAPIGSPRIGSQKSGTPSSGPAAGSARSGRSSSERSLDVEVSCDEDVLESDSREREVTPCNLMRDVETIRTMGSTTKSTYSIVSKQRKQNAISQYIPSNQEMEEIFAGIEKLQQEKFIEKYNFDPVNDCPLPGRYEWEKIDS